MRSLRSGFNALLKQGLTPEKLALSVALGAVIGVFPVPGTTTLLCAAVAFVCGLNQPAIQSVNYLVYPLQLVLLIPWYQMGERLFHIPPTTLSLSGIPALFARGTLQAMSALWRTSLHAIAAWGLAASVVTPPLFFILRAFFRKAKTGHKNSRID